MAETPQPDLETISDEELEKLLETDQRLSLLLEALERSPEQRLLEGMRLSRRARCLHPRPWKPFWKTFDSFEELDAWKKEQEDPRLW